MTQSAKLLLTSMLLVITLFAGLTLPTRALAHPHVFIENKLDIVFDENGLAGFQVTWSFDEMFTIMVLEDILGLTDSPMETSHVPVVKQQAFDHLREDDYFTKVCINKASFRVQFIEAFSARMDKERLVYEFFIPCHVKALSSWQSVAVAQYDPSFYAALFLAEDPITVRGAQDYQVEHETAVNKEKSYYYGMVHPWETLIRFRRKDG